VVEQKLPKLRVEGSIPFTRSKVFDGLGPPGAFFMLRTPRNENQGNTPIFMCDKPRHATKDATWMPPPAARKTA
jgi:hypothetical protein